jgi:ribonuclease G
LFDIDGPPPADALALTAAPQIAAAIVRHDIGGSIGVDFPTIEGKTLRNAVAAAIDEALPQPFERTAVNGFGFLQIVRPRPRASLPERLRADPAGAAARAVLRRLEREPPGAPPGQRVSPAVHAKLRARPDWLAELARRTGITHEWESG